MNLSNREMAGAKKIAATARIFRQSCRHGLLCAHHMILSRIQNFLFSFALVLGSLAHASAQTNYYVTNGTEYAVIGTLPGDQVHPDAALSSAGGFVVWQDNITDGSGMGISARRLDSTLSGTLSTFRVNVTSTNDQENPRVALLKNGTSAFVWQGGKKSSQHIYARFLSMTNTWLTTTDLVLSATTNFQVDPAIATLNNSNIVVVWGSFDQFNSNSLQDVYGQILSPGGQKIGTNFLINQFTPYNQRTPAIAPLKNGGFVVTWVSEQQRAVAGTYSSASAFYTAASVPTPSIDIYARLFTSNGIATGNEFLVNSNLNPCANPAVAAASDGSFMVAWDARDLSVLTNGYDVFARSFSNNGVGGIIATVNSYIYGDQYAPRISTIGSDYMIVWTSLGEDGSREGVFGQFLRSDGSLFGNEILVNTTTASQQLQPALTSDGTNQFLVVWTSYTGTANSFDLYAQRYINASAILAPMNAPFISVPFNLNNGIYQPQIKVSWPMLLGIEVSNYEVYVDGASSPITLTTGNSWNMTTTNGLTASSTHYFTLDYVTTDGRRSPLSPVARGSTWSGANWGGIPYEWMTQYFGSNTNSWPAATADTDGDGVNNLQEYMSGTIPTNAASVLQVQLTSTRQGMFLNWSTQPGLTYQVISSTNFITWNNFSTPRFAAGTNDSIYVGGSSAGFYRVVLLHQ
jgi:hypothetical protein